MAGYDKSRIVDVKGNDLDEFTCGICLNVLNKPVVVQCCRQSFCKHCIQQWLIQNKTCPNDRQTVTTLDITPAPRLILNVLNNMRIRCDRYLDGCRAVVTIGQIDEHVDECEFYQCSNCGTKDPGANHECVKHLLQTIDHLQDKLNELSLVNAGQTQRNSTKNYIKRVIESARSNLDNYAFKSRRGKVVETDVAIRFVTICQKAIVKEDTLNNMTTHIRQEINRKFSEGGKYTWQVILVVFNSDGGNQSSFSVLHVNIMSVVFDKLEITIFSSPRTSKH